MYIGFVIRFLTQVGHSRDSVQLPNHIPACSCNVLGPTRVVVPTRVFSNGVVWLEASESLEPVPARVDTPDVRFRLSERVRSRWFYLCAVFIFEDGSKAERQASESAAKESSSAFCVTSSGSYPRTRGRSAGCVSAWISLSLAMLTCV